MFKVLFISVFLAVGCAKASSRLVIVDSTTMPGESYIFIDDCFLPVKSSEIKNLCELEARIKKECNIMYELGENCGEK